MLCPITMVATYTFQVISEDSGQNITVQSATSSGPAASFELGNLIETETYIYTIVAINAIGRTTTASNSFRKFQGEKKLLEV